jgi:hypothetical protein
MKLFAFHHTTSPTDTPTVTLQLILHLRLPTLQTRHRHDLHHKTSPSSKMLRALPQACFGIVLLPRKARPLPFLEDVLY